MKYILIIMAALCTGFGYIAWGKLQVSGKKTKVFEGKHQKSQPPTILYDKAQLLKFQQLCKAMDPSAETYQMEAKLLIIDGADSTAKEVAPINYFAGKNGKDFYCKMGPNEMINTNGLLLNINHQTKMVMVKGGQDIPQLNVVPDIKNLMKTLSAEGYELKEGVTNGEAYIKFVNEYHISCKEYKIGYDSATMKPSSFYLRLTNLDYPEDKSKDKVISLEGLKISPNFSITELKHIPKVIEVDGELKLTGSLSDYYVVGL